MRPLLLSDRSRNRGIYDMKKLDRLLTARGLRRREAGDTAFRLLSVELWFRLFIDGEGRPERLTDEP